MTHTVLHQLQPMDDFNPHSREGSDDQYLYWSLGVWDFNPHSREGSDIVGLSEVLYGFISIHTPAKGVTTPFRIYSHLFQISIHTPAKGVTCRLLEKEQQIRISIHTPAKGVTRRSWNVLPKSRISIHTPAKGVTTKSISYDSGTVFQSTLPRRE